MARSALAAVYARQLPRPAMVAISIPTIGKSSDKAATLKSSHLLCLRTLTDQPENFHRAY